MAARLAGAPLSLPLESPGGTPRVSVVVPCYNYGHYLGRCVGSVLAQSGVEVDVIVVDDASPDGSGKVAAALAAADGRVQVLQHDHNAGHIATYNDGLALAEGDYVVLLSADDLVAPGALGRATTLMEHRPEVGFVYGPVRTFCHDRLQLPDATPTGWAVWPGKDWLVRRWRQGRNCIWSPEVVMRASVQRAVGEYRRDLPHTADLDVWMRAAAVSDVGYVMGVEQAGYRVHASNMHARDFDGRGTEGILIDLRERLRTFDTFPNALALGLDRGVARRALSREALLTACRPYSRRIPDCETMQRLIDFAEEIDPLVRRSHHWRAARRRLALARSAVPPQSDASGLLELAGRAGGRLQRWPGRRVGV